MSIDKAFEKWFKDKFGQILWNISKGDNAYFVEVRKESYTAGYKQGVKDEKKRISDGLRELEKK